MGSYTLSNTMPTPLRFSIARAVSKDSKIQKSLAFLPLRMLSTYSLFQGLDALKAKMLTPLEVSSLMYPMNSDGWCPHVCSNRLQSINCSPRRYSSACDRRLWNSSRMCGCVCLCACYLCIYVYLLKIKLRISDFQHFHRLAGHRLSAHILSLPNMVDEHVSK